LNQNFYLNSKMMMMVMVVMNDKEKTYALTYRSIYRNS